MERDATVGWWRQALKYHSRLKKQGREREAAYMASMLDEELLPEDYYRSSELNAHPWRKEFLRLQYEH